MNSLPIQFIKIHSHTRVYRDECGLPSGNFLLIWVVRLATWPCNSATCAANDATCSAKVPLVVRTNRYRNQKDETTIRATNVRLIPYSFRPGAALWGCLLPFALSSKLPQQSDGLDSQFSFLFSTSFRRDPGLHHGCRVVEAVRRENAVSGVHHCLLSLNN